MSVLRQVKKSLLLPYRGKQTPQHLELEQLEPDKGHFEALNLNMIAECVRG
jgi:hypothetical protein